ncbi:Protein of unknown function [Andreprevotia lacus DSM 23236]|jgi:hypothetical protein|uniref:DUF3261 domain-containing protein n=1 Tax=Andreprevotia lacus DSM 23236 TaxID=1121001 RepID=A0A1W1X3W8_9NEIS|nr:DUF3261 domain-containing protein [Andreprevotia lacus]SMC18567.1 Protein of unknown function [Andreprevotia lacus DSM 23236]
MRRILMRLLPACAVLLLAGCASLLPGSLPLLQLPPATLGGERTLEQRLTLQWPGQTRSMEVVTSIDERKLSLLGMALGVRLFALDYDGTTLNKTEYVPLQLPAERMLNDFLLVHAPADALARSLPAGWRVVDSDLHRSVLHGDAEIITITYSEADRWRGHAQLRNPALHYQLDIDTADAQ